MADFYEQFEPQEEPLEPVRKRPLSGCWLLLTAVIIITLLGSSLSGAGWLLFGREDSPLRRPSATAVALPSPMPTATPVGTPTTTAAAETTTPATDEINRIAYIDNNGQLRTIAPNGQDERILTDSNQIFRFPTWSPTDDGLAILGSDALGTAVYVINDTSVSRKTTDPTRLYFGSRTAPFYLYWSPDGRTISFLANHPDGIGLHLVPADGSAESRLRTIGGPIYWQWTPDSSQMFIHSGFSGSDARLELLAATDDSAGQSIATPGFFQTPAISNDGRFWAYAQEKSLNRSELIVADTNTGDNQQQPHTGTLVLSMSPTGQEIAFISPIEADAENFVGPLQLMDSATGQTTLISQQNVAAFFWSPNGRYIAAFIPQTIFGNDINAAKHVPPLAKPTQQSLPTLNLVIFDTETGEGRQILTFQPTLTFLSQFMPYFDQYALSHRIWSPNSQSIVLPILEDGRSHIYIIPINGSPKQFLATGSMSSWSQK